MSGLTGATTLRVLVLTGKKNRELADLLGMSERTLKFHIGNLTEIFGVSSRLQPQARVTTDVLSALALAEGQRKFSTTSDKRALQASKLLSTIFEGDEGPLGQTFAETLRPKDLKAKR